MTHDDAVSSSTWALPPGWQLSIDRSPPGTAPATVRLLDAEGRPVATLTTDDARALAAALGDPAPRWRHLARGTTYTEIGHATLKQAVPATLTEGDLLVVYRSDADGTLGARLVSEFLDGRFERVAD